MNRALYWLTVAVTVGVLAGMATLVWQSHQPRPGAKMVLMGLPCLAVPGVTAAVATLGLAHAGDGEFRRWECRTGRVVGWLALGLSAAFLVLG